MTGDAAAVASARAEVAWHQAGLDILGVPWTIDDSMWWRTVVTTPVFLAAITLDRSVSAVQLAGAVAGLGGDVAVLDSFDALDMAPHGYRRVYTEPWMMRRAGPFGSIGAAPAGFSVTRAIEPGDVALFERTVFMGMTGEYAEHSRGSVHPPTTGQFDTLRLLVGRAGGEAVAAGLSVPCPDGVLVSGIATPAPHRRRGYGAAITRAVCETQPADDAFLRASDMGRPTYERLGFATVGWATVWARDEATI